MGWQVRRGEKGVLLEKWIFDEEQTVVNPETGKEERKKVKLEHPKCNLFYAFNAEQIHGVPELEKFTPKSQDEYLAMADQMKKISACPIYEGGNDAYYDTRKDEIHLPTREQFHNTESFLATMLHEMGHSTGAKTRLNRDMTGTFGTANYAKEELRAEISSIFTQSDFKLPITAERMQNNSNYLLSWIQVLKNDPNEFFRACKDADQASQYIIDRYQKMEKTKAQDQIMDTHDAPNVHTGTAPVQAIDEQTLQMIRRPAPRRYAMGQDGQMSRTFYGKFPEEFTDKDKMNFSADLDLRLIGKVDNSRLIDMHKEGYIMTIDNSFRKGLEKIPADISELDKFNLMLNNYILFNGEIPEQFLSNIAEAGYRYADGAVVPCQAPAELHREADTKEAEHVISENISQTQANDARQHTETSAEKTSITIKGLYFRPNDGMEFVHYVSNGREHLTNGIRDWQNTKDDPERITKYTQLLEKTDSISIDIMKEALNAHLPEHDFTEFFQAKYEFSKPIPEAKRICQELKKMGCQPDKKTVNCIIRLQKESGKKMDAAALKELKPGHNRDVNSTIDKLTRAVYSQLSKLAVLIQ